MGMRYWGKVYCVNCTHDNKILVRRGMLNGVCCGNGLVFSERELKFMFAIGYRPSVCLSVCRLSVTFVHPTQAIEIFGNISTPCGTLAIHELCIKSLRRSSKKNPSVGGVKHKRGSRI